MTSKLSHGVFEISKVGFNRHISSSDGTSLRFDNKQTYDAYEFEAKLLQDKYYAIDRAKNGIWCGNQGKYVHSRDEMNDWDGHTMENRFDANQPAIVYTGFLVCHDISMKQVAYIPLISCAEKSLVESYLEVCHHYFNVIQIEEKLRSAFKGCTISVKVQ